MIVRWLPFRVDASPSQLRFIIEPATPDPDGGVFSYQWQQQSSGAEWSDIPDATTATYWLPADANGSIRYRLGDIKHTDGGGYIIKYPDRGPFRASADDDGDGLIDIYTLEDLDAIRYQLNGRAYQPDENAEPVMQGCPPTGCKGYELMRSLDFNVADSYRDSMIDTTWTTSTGWQPIGSESNGFSGIFEGNGYTISGLYISSLGSIRWGLFFFLESGSEIRNIGLLNVDVGGVSNDIGGLVGRNDGSISNSYVTGVVTGNSFIGGLVGQNGDGSSITNSYAMVDVTGTGDNVGGLVSRNDGSIINSYAIGDVTGTGDNVGGLVSRNDGSIINSYAIGDVTGKNFVGGLTGWNSGPIINSYATGDVTGKNFVGGLTGWNSGPIINSYATGDITGDDFVGGLVGGNEDIITNSYATGVVDGREGDNVGGLVGSLSNSSNVTASYWDTEESDIMTSAVGIGKTTDELQLPTEATGIYRDWSSDDWDFGTTSTYPTLRYAKGGNLNACTTEITTSSTMLPCGIALPNPSDSERNKGLAGIFFFADGELASVVSNPPFFQLTYNYDMTIVASDLDIHLRPYALNNNATIAISKGDTHYFSDDRPNGALSDTIRLIDNETTLTIVITDIIDEVPVNTTYTYVIVRWLPFRVSMSQSQLHLIFEPATPDPDGGGFSYQWQQRVPGSGWTNIPNATTPTYWLSPDAGGSIRYRLGNIKHTDGGGYETIYPPRGLFRTSADDDGDGLIDIYYLEDLDALRYQLDGRAYQLDENAEPIMRGCPATGCNGYELMRSLDFNVADSYQANRVDTTWTAGAGWQPIGSDGNRFSGLFEGNGYTIANLLMDRAESHLGLFSVLHTNGRIQNVGLLETEVEGDDSTIGSLVASNYGSIINSYATGNITDGESVGGLVGSNYGSIINSYATGNVTEGISVGGLVGQNRNIITNSYATGNVGGGTAVGGLVGENRNIITNSYATGNVTGSANSVGGLVGENRNIIINSYATGVVGGTANNLGGLVGNLVSGNVTASYWDTKESGIMTSAAGIGKTTDELQLPTEATGIYSGWSSDDWDFGTTITYPTLRYAEGGNLNTCTTEITTSSTMLPCGIALPNPSDSDRNKGLAGIFFFADGEPASVVWDPIFSQLIYNYDMSIVVEDLDIQIRPYAINDNAAIAISKGDTHYFSDDRPNGALSDTIRLDDNKTITIVITDIIDETTIHTIYTFVVERLLPVQVDVSLARFSATVASATSDPGGGGVFSYQWQQQTLENGWIDIPDATTATYWLPADANSSIPYRVNIKYTDGGGGETIYPPQGPFKASVDDDGDGLIDIYYLEDLNALRYQLDGRAYQLAADAEPIMRGCPATGCNGYELMRSLDFNISDSYQDSMIETLWTASTGWQPIGSDANRFSGIFEGNGHTIRNLFMDRSGSNLGLFSVLHADGRIQNVGLLDAEVAGTGTTSRIGGLVGQNFGAIINSYVMGSVTGMSNDVGGLVGNNNGSIINSYATGNVTGRSRSATNIGGLAGFNGGSIINSHATGNVTEGVSVGGLVGWNDNRIINSYATGNVTVGVSVGGLVGWNDNRIINSYATGDVTWGVSAGGLVGYNLDIITNSYATGNVTGYSRSIGGLVGLMGNRNVGGSIINSYATGNVTGNSTSIGGLVGELESGNVTASYWDTEESGIRTSAAGVGKTTDELQLPTAATGIYSGWSSDDWDFGTTITYPTLRYAEGGNLNACTTEITTSSTMLPCGIALPNPSDSDRNKGLAGIFFFADGEQASVVLNPLFSQQIYHYDMSIVAEDLNIQLRSYAINDNARITISDQDNQNYFADKLNGELSDAIGLENNETTLTIVITDIIDETTVHTIYTFVIVRWLPIRVDANPSRLHFILEPATPDPDGGVFSYQWQQRVLGSGWTDLANATTPTYWLPTDANGSIRYRLVNIKHTDGGGYITQYPDQGPFRISVDDDGDGLIDIYTLEDLDTIRYQLDGRAYQPSENAEPLMRGCPQQVCKGYELMRSLDFNVADSYRDNPVDTTWTTSTGWQPIGSDANRFSGLFEGNGHTISNLYMNRDTGGLGLFAVLHANGRIQNVGLLAAEVEGTESSIGSLVGESHGSIINSYATGLVSGDDNVGSLVGESHGSIINSYAMGNVSGVGDDVGGLVGESHGSIINSYATGLVTGDSNVGGLVGINISPGSIINSYATGLVSGNDNVGGLIGGNSGSVTASYWDANTSNQLTSAGGDGVTSATIVQLQSPTAPGTATTEVYYGWSSADWDFGDNSHYPALRYAEGDSLNACLTEITPSSTALPCGILLPNQSGRNQGLAGVFFFADGKVAPTILMPLLSQLGYSYEMIIASGQNMQLRPYALNDNATIAISDHRDGNYFSDVKPNGALSDVIEWDGDATTLTVIVTDVVDGDPANTTYTFAVTGVVPLDIAEISVTPSGVVDEGSDMTITFTVSGGLGEYEYAYALDGEPLSSPSQPLLQFTIPTAIVASDRTTQTVEVNLIVRDDIQIIEHPLALTVRKVDNGDDFSLSSEVSPSRLSVMFADTDADGEGIVSYQWQQLALGGEWSNIVAATTATYYLPADTDGSIRYRVNVQHTDGQGYINNYQQGPFRTGDIDDDDDGLIEIYYLEDVDTMRYQLDGSGYKMSMSASASMHGCPDLGCSGYELMRYLDFNNAIDYSAISNSAVWTTGTSWQPIGTRIDPFSGLFEGNSYTLSGLQINRSASDIGLFSVLHADGEIKNVGLLEVNVQGDDNVGSLVGENNGSIINSYATGTVNGAGTIGGLVGLSSNAIISSFANVAVSGNNVVGGLVGESVGNIANTYAAGTVSITDAADQVLGGLVGRNEGSITNSYAFSRVMPGIESAAALQADGLVGVTTGSAAVISASYWDSTVNASLTMSENAKTTAELQSPTEASGIYSDWSGADWDFGDNSHYPALRYASGDDLNACLTEITPSSTALPCGILLPNQSGRNQGLAGVFFFADGKVAPTILTPLLSQFSYSYDTRIVTTETAVQLTLRPYAINDNATITITDQDNTSYFAGKPNGALSDLIMLSEPITLTLVITDTINEALMNTTYTFAIKRSILLEVSAITLTPDATATIDEGDTITLTFDVSGGSDTYEYAYLLDGQPLPSPSQPPFEFTLATDIVDADATMQRVELTIRVSDDEGQTFEYSEDLTINKVNNGDAVITSEISSKYLRIILGESDVDGEGDFVIQWQSQVAAGDWMAIAGATTATYWLPVAADRNIRYRAVDISYTDGQGYVMNYADQGPFLGEAIVMGDIDVEGPTNEGSTFTLSAPLVSGGSGEYRYEWMQTAEDSKQLSGHSALTLVSTNTATVNAQIPADFIAMVATSANITFKVIVRDGEFTTSRSTVVTINKIDNSSPAITVEVSSSRLSISLVTPDADGEGDFSLQWQSQESEEEWMDITDATMATYRVPIAADRNIRYRAVKIRYTDGQGYVMNYADQGPFLGETIVIGDISGEGQASEGSTFTLGASSVSGGSREYRYEWMQTAEDSMQLSGHSALTLTGTNTATVNAQIPADFIAMAATSAHIIFKVVVSDGFTMTSRSKVVTIHKINNGPADITITEMSGTLSIAVNDPDGNATDPNYTYQWQRFSPESDPPWMNINTATAATYDVPDDTPIDTRFRVLVTYTDGQGYNETVESAEIVYPSLVKGIKVRTKVFLEGPLR